jgi:hypothetical protein
MNGGCKLKSSSGAEVCAADDLSKINLVPGIRAHSKDDATP